MKTSTSEVRCDACDKVIPVMHPTALFVTLRGPKVGHRKLDCCDAWCLRLWATQYDLDIRADAALGEAP